MNKNSIELDIPAWERDTKRYTTDVVGAWLRLCIAAHASEPRGVVRDTLQGMAAIMGTGSTTDTQRLLELIGLSEAGKPSLGDVEYSLDATYTVTVRRMVRETGRSRKAAEKVRKTRTEVIELPNEMQQNDQFKQTWEAWMSYRRNELRKPMPPTTQRGQIGKLVQEAREHGMQAAVDMITRSMDNGWTGLFTSEERATRIVASTSRRSPLEQAAAAASFFKQ